jgi:copper chaperone CopZ
MKKLLLILLFVPLFTIGQDKVKFIAAGVTCSMCSNAILKSITTDKSVQKVDPNLQTQEWNLEYPKGEFKLELLKKRVEDAGFSLAKVWLNNELIFDSKKKKLTKK